MIDCQDECAEVKVFVQWNENHPSYLIKDSISFFLNNFLRQLYIFKNKKPKKIFVEELFIKKTENKNKKKTKTVLIIECHK